MGLTAGLPDVVAAQESHDPVGAHRRRTRAYRIRERAAAYQRRQPLARHENNGDEAAYANRIGNYGKGLPHDDLGCVDPTAYDRLVQATSGDEPGDMDAIRWTARPG